MVVIEANPVDTFIGANSADVAVMLGVVVAAVTVLALILLLLVA